MTTPEEIQLRNVDDAENDDDDDDVGEETQLRRRLVRPSQDDVHDVLKDELRSSKFGRKVLLARRQIADPWWCIGLQVVVIGLTVLFTYYAYYYFDHLHYKVTRGYAHMGYDQAQYKVAMHLLKGKGTEMNETEAHHWMKAASDQGHPEASFHLAVAHLKGKEVGLNPGDAHPLLMHAAQHGLKTAQKMVKEVCVKGGCDH